MHWNRLVGRVDRFLALFLSCGAYFGIGIGFGSQPWTRELVIWKKPRTVVFPQGSGDCREMCRRERARMSIARLGEVCYVGSEVWWVGVWAICRIPRDSCKRVSVVTCEHVGG
jgi:hypothetical protein